MPLRIRPESVFCLEFTHEKDEFTPHNCTIPQLVTQKAKNNQTAFVFDAEKLSFSFAGVRTEMDALAAGFLAIGLKPNDRILICGYNNAQTILTALGASRAGLIFSLASPNFSTPEQLRHFLSAGSFRATILFAPTVTAGSDYTYDNILAICPELKSSHRGRLSSPKLPHLSTVILGDEDHKHAGTFTLSEVLGKSSKQRVEKLPDYKVWNPHRMAAIQFTLGATGLPKAVALSHYQLINGCRVAAGICGIRKESVLGCALPMNRIAVFCLGIFSPFLFECKTVISEPSPIPRLLFSSINRHRCSLILSNAIAMRLLLKMGATQKITLPSVMEVVLLGERVSTELLSSIEKVMPNAKRIAVGMILTEVGAVPLLSDKTTNLIRSAGRVLEGYAIDVIPVDKLTVPHNSGLRIGELRVRPLQNTKFIGYDPEFSANTDWIETGDIATISREGNVEIIANRADLIYDRMDQLVEHWKAERAMASDPNIKGIQLVQMCQGAPVVAIVVPKKKDFIPEFIRTDLSNICRKNKLPVPDHFAFVDDFPRVHTRIQKFRLREMLRKKLLGLY